MKYLFVLALSAAQRRSQEKRRTVKHHLLPFAQRSGWNLTARGGDPSQSPPYAHYRSGRTFPQGPIETDIDSTATEAICSVAQLPGPREGPAGGSKRTAHFFAIATTA